MKYELTKMYYVASPYTAKEGTPFERTKLQQKRFNAVNKAIGRLNDIYEYAFIGPITQSHITVKHQKNKNTTFANWAKKDFTYISRCDGLWVLMLDGWRESTGVQEEIKFAKAHNIEVKYLEPRNLQLLEEAPNEIKICTSNCS